MNKKNSSKVCTSASAKEQYRKVLQFLKRVESSEPVNLKEMLGTYVNLFLVIRDSLEKGSEEQANESLWILGEFYALVNEESKKLRNQTGLTDHEINMASQNPNFFTLEQWNIIEHTREKMHKMGLQVADLVQKRCL